MHGPIFIAFVGCLGRLMSAPHSTPSAGASEGAEPSSSYGGGGCSLRRGEVNGGAAWKQAFCMLFVSFNLAEVAGEALGAEVERPVPLAA